MTLPTGALPWSDPYSTAGKASYIFLYEQKHKNKNSRILTKEGT